MSAAQFVPLLSFGLRTTKSLFFRVQTQTARTEQRPIRPNCTSRSSATYLPEASLGLFRSIRASERARRMLNSFGGLVLVCAEEMREKKRFGSDVSRRKHLQPLTRAQRGPTLCSQLVRRLRVSLERASDAKVSRNELAQKTDPMGKALSQLRTANKSTESSGQILALRTTGNESDAQKDSKQRRNLADSSNGANQIISDSKVSLQTQATDATAKTNRSQTSPNFCESDWS